MKYIDSLKYLSKDPMGQMFQYWIYRTDYKFAIKHPLAEGSVDKILKYQEKINGLYTHILNNLDKYVANPKSYLEYLHDSIRLKYSDEDLFNAYQTEFQGLNINLERLNFLFNGDEYKYCIEEFTRLKSVENAMPEYMQNSTYIDSDKFISRGTEMCKQFGLAGIIVPNVLKTEEFFVNLEKNISFLSQKALIQSQAFGGLETIILIDDKDFSGLPNELYNNIEKQILPDNKFVLKINTEAFRYENFVNMPEEKLRLLTENVSKKKQYKM